MLNTQAIKAKPQ